VGYFVSTAHKGWFESTESFKGTQKDPYKKILIVDDSPFFCNMLSPMLGSAGYEVVSTKSALEALNLCQRGEKFDIIISDIEMPDMNGYEFAQKVKSSESSWKGVPLLALSSHNSPQDLLRGKAAGFDDYIAKSDRNILLKTISRMGDAA